LVPSQPIFRFAPSPNGLLHLGHAYSVLFMQYWARKMQAKMLLRIEDIDTQRCRPEFAQAAIEDLEWLGLAFDGPVFYQSRHFPDYGAAADALRSQGLLYPCFCSRKDIKGASTGAVDPDGAPIYPGTCRDLSADQRKRRLAAGEPVQWRLDMAKAVAVAGPIEIMETMPTPDQRVEMRNAEPERWGDVVLVRKDTPTSYHLSVVVDDARQGITHVIRGMDLYKSTDIHVLLQFLLGLPSPFYCHHKLVRDESAEKLSKSAGARSLKAMRLTGITPDDIRQRHDLIK